MRLPTQHHGSQRIAKRVEDALYALKNDGYNEFALYYGDLTDQDIQKHIIPVIKGQQVTFLKLGNNKITGEGICALLSELKSSDVYVINLSHNQISDCGLQALLKKIESLELCDLDLSHNQIGPAGICALAEFMQKNPPLSTLNMGYNKPDLESISALALALAKNKHTLSLTTDRMHVEDQKICREGVKILVRNLAYHPSLSVLHLRNNFLEDNDISSIVEMLKVNKKLHILDLQYNPISKEGAKLLLSAFIDNHTLEHLYLDLSSQGMDEKERMYFKAELEKCLEQNRNNNRTLRYIANLGGKDPPSYLDFQHLGDQNIVRLVDALIELKNQTVQFISFKDHRLECHAGISALGRLLKENKNNIQQLDLSGSEFPFSAWCQLIDGFKYNQKLQILKLEYCRVKSSISVCPFKILADALEKNTSLRELYLKWSGLEKYGAEYLARALVRNPQNSLQNLFLEGNYIKTEGALALANMLKTNTTLKQLSLMDNHIGKDGIIALASALEKNESLEKLNLIGNSLTLKGATALAAMLKKNGALLELDLKRNILKDEAALVFAEALGTNGRLQVLSFFNHDFTVLGVNALVSVFDKNRTLHKISLYEDERRVNIREKELEKAQIQRQLDEGGDNNRVFQLLHVIFQSTMPFDLVNLIASYYGQTLIAPPPARTLAEASQWSPKLTCFPPSKKSKREEAAHPITYS